MIDTPTYHVTKIALNGLRKEVRLQNISLSKRFPNNFSSFLSHKNQIHKSNCRIGADFLYVFGGDSTTRDSYTSNEFVKSKNMYKLCWNSKQIKELELPELLQGTAAISSSSSFWFSENSMIAYGK